MSIEPIAAETVERISREAAVALVDWSVYRKCRICGAEPGRPCRSMYSAVRTGRPDGPPQNLTIAHGYRARLAGR